MKGARVIRKHNRRAAKAAFAISLGVAIVIGLVAAVVARPAHANRTMGPTVILGSKNFPEEDILGQLYKQALEAKGFHVSYKSQIGSTELMTSALQSGKINMYPEYTGVIVQVVFHRTFSPKTAAATYKLAKKLEATKGYASARTRRRSTTPTCLRDERHGGEVRAEVGRRPEQGRQLQARRLPGVQDPQHLLRRLHQAVRADEGVIRAARGHLRVRGA
jgi:Periplasmic glycine betaine/choline-binding (lipo)protein of an ABC-type transport system (osmoprotectant binding protein)